MRQIKFRAWDDGIMITSGDLGDFFKFIRDDAIVMQFTGLLDKTGMPIYEGDVVKVPDGRIEQVIWSIKCETHAGHGDSSTNVCAGFNIGGYGRFESNEFEVLGNIYQNADLLK